MKLTITAIGEPKDVQTKFGMKQKSYIKAKEHGDNYLSYWVNSSTRNWKVGDEIDVLDVTPREYNGKTYYDVILPKTSGGFPPEVAKTLETILSMVTRINLTTVEILNRLPRDIKKEYAPALDEEDYVPNPEDVPF